MTETEWRETTTSPKKMFQRINDPFRRRQLRLAAAAACRLVERFIVDDRVRDALDAHERLALNEITQDEYETLLPDLLEARRLVPISQLVGPHDPVATATQAVVTALYVDSEKAIRQTIDWVLEADSNKRATIRHTLCDIARDLGGNPFRPWIHYPPSYPHDYMQPDGRQVTISETARSLAFTIQRERSFHKLPILADALEESGVTDSEILEYLRSKQKHYLGCWACTLALGRTK